MPTQNEMNRVAWPFLVAAAQEGRTVTYRQFADAINRQCGTRYTAHLIGPQALDRIETYCIRTGLPDLTALVVHGADGLPGQDVFRRNGMAGYLEASAGRRRYFWNTIRDRVFATTWPDRAPPDWSPRHSWTLMR